jgi:hypothetical protein
MAEFIQGTKPKGLFSLKVNKNNVLSINKILLSQITNALYIMPNLSQFGGGAVRLQATKIDLSGALSRAQ